VSRARTWRNRDRTITLHLADSAHWMRTAPSQSVDMIFTDPPYGHKNNDGDLISNIEKALGQGGKHAPRPILSDDSESAHSLATVLFAESKRLLRHGGCCCCCCCCGGGGPDPQFARWSLMMDEHLAFKQMIVWDKGRMGLGWHYRRSYEVVLVGQRDKGKCKWHDRTRRIENVIRPGDHGIKKIIPTKQMHPTAKPWRLAAHFIGLHSQPGDTVLDPFTGGGSTLEAATRLERRFIGVELDPEWFDHCVESAKAA
jgi:site-specific DNA-methyltransferase (adenine-specific)